jgi:hypothetical protein
MKSRIENGNLIIELPLEEPRPSKSGKTLLVASTRGVKPSAAQLKGKMISIVANAFIFPDKTTASSDGRSSKGRLRESKKERSAEEYSDGDEDDC